MDNISKWQKHFENLSRLYDSPAQQLMRQLADKQNFFHSAQMLAAANQHIQQWKHWETLADSFKSSTFKSLEIPPSRINELISSLNIPEDKMSELVNTRKLFIETSHVYMPSQVIELIQKNLANIYLQPAWADFQQQLSLDTADTLDSVSTIHTRSRKRYRFKRLPIITHQNVKAKRLPFIALSFDRLISLASLFVSFYSCIQDEEIRVHVRIILTAIFAVLTIQGYINSDDD